MTQDNTVQYAQITHVHIALLAIQSEDLVFFTLSIHNRLAPDFFADRSRLWYVASYGRG
jgi:hypothetical protein